MTKKPRQGKKDAKKPAARFASSEAKAPRVLVETTDSHVAWRLGMIDFGGPWCWTELERDKKREIYGKLAQYENKSWGEFGGRGGNKNISVESLCPDAQKRLRTMKLDDAEGALWELRFSGVERVWGIRQGDILHFLWWDPDHTVCPSVKR